MDAEKLDEGYQLWLGEKFLAAIKAERERQGMILDALEELGEDEFKRIQDAFLADDPVTLGMLIMEAGSKRVSVIAQEQVDILTEAAYLAECKAARDEVLDARHFAGRQP